MAYLLDSQKNSNKTSSFNNLTGRTQNTTSCMVVAQLLFYYIKNWENQLKDVKFGTSKRQSKS